MDIHIRWRVLQNASGGELIAFAVLIVKEYWHLSDEMPTLHKEILNSFYRDALSGDYQLLKETCAEFVWDNAGIRLDPNIEPA